MSSSNAPHTPSLAQTPSRRPLLAALILLCSFFVITYAARLEERRRLEQEIVVQEQAIVAAQERNAQLQKELEQANAPAFLDEIARTVFQLGREGETLFVAIAPPAQPEPQALPVIPSARLPVWREWLELIFPTE